MVRSASGRGSIKVSLVGLLCLLACLGAAIIYGAKPLKSLWVTDSDLIRLSDMELEHAGSELQLHANAHVRLPPTVQAGLESGVPLTFVLDLQVSKPARFWPDKRIVDVDRHFTLTYYELTRHYRVMQVETDTGRNFRSLSSALDGLGKLGTFRFDINQEQEAALNQDGLFATLRMRLLTSALPLPLQPIIGSGWKLGSEVYRWPVT